MDKQEHLQVANTIIRQMGGAGKLKAMVGMRGALALDNTEDGGLQFSFRGSRRANKCRIVYHAWPDLYTVQLWKISPTAKREPQMVFELEDVYNDMLKRTFEQETGLYLSL